MNSSRIVLMSPSFTPARLFRGVAGLWYLPANLASMFQDSAGTIPAAINSPVGKILDLSGNGIHATQSTDSQRPTLKQDGAGRCYLEFDGLSQFLTIDAGTTLTVSQSTIALAAKARNLTSTYQGGLQLVNQVLYLSTNSNVWGGFNGVALNSSHAPSSTLVMVERTVAANNVDLFTNNYAPERKTDGAAFDVRGSYLGTAAPGVQLGQMDFYGCVVTASVLTDTDVYRTSRYLAGKSGAY